MFTPSSGTPITIADNSGSIVGSLATFNPTDWINVTSMVVSYAGASGWCVGLDNILFSISNTAPVLAGVDNTSAYTEGGSAVTLDGNATVNDTEFDALNGASGNYSGASLSLIRNGGANANDTFAISTGGNLTVAGGPNGGGTITAVAEDNDSADSSSAIQATITVNAVNDAPVLDNTKTPVLGAINEDAGAPSGAVGTLISSLVDIVGALSNVTDSDATPSTGIAITASNATNGSWRYSTNNGTSWNILGSPSGSASRLLAADANTRIYFQPNANFNGTVSSAITFRAWDTTSGSNGGTTDTDTNGNAMAFSTATDTANITVNAVNDDPVIASLPTDIIVTEDTASNVDLSAVTLSDVDSGANSITLTIVAGAGTLTASTGGSVTVGGSGTGTLTLNGTVANIDTFLNTAANIKYTGASNTKGDNVTTLILTANDSGNTGSGGGTNVALGTVNVDITNVNDNPTDISITNLTIQANSGNAVVGDLSTTDPDN